MPVLGVAAQRGDLIARVRVLLPERLTPEEKRLFEDLRALREGAGAHVDARG